jgi:phosphopantothenoylcysteine decarboxylase/phosphopantothenate--cysteine ligase
MSEPEEIVAAVAGALGRAQDLLGKTVIVTAGGTQEPIDPVRFIGNRSSGRMGYAIAREAVARGAKVLLVSGPTELSAPPGVGRTSVQTAEEMLAAVLDHSPTADVIVKAAAVADFRPESSAAVKLKKAAGPPEVVLIPNRDILSELGHSSEFRKGGSILVGFAAETEPDPAGLARLAVEKLESKAADLIVANDVSSPDSGFSVRTNRAVIASRAGTADVGLVTKDELARLLIDHVVNLLA